MRRYSALASLVLDEVIDVPAPGSCTVTAEATSLSGGSEWNDPTRALPAPGLDAGGSIVVTGANVGTTLTGGPGVYQPSQGGQFLSPGPYTVKATGGPDVSAFQVAVTVPSPFTWTNPGEGTIIDRSQGITLTWSGADPSGYVTVSGYGQDAGGVAFFSCTGRASDGSLTVPPFVLQGLPTFGTVTGALQVESVSQPVQFAATGLD